MKAKKLPQLSFWNYGKIFIFDYSCHLTALSIHIYQRKKNLLKEVLIQRIIKDKPPHSKYSLHYQCPSNSLNIISSRTNNYRQIFALSSGYWQSYSIIRFRWLNTKVSYRHFDISHFSDICWRIICELLPTSTPASTQALAKS